MRAVIATFEHVAGADAFARSVRRRLGLDVSMGTAGAYGEPFDGHRLAVAWVPEDEVSVAEDLALGEGGRIHEAPSTAIPIDASGDR